MAHHDPAWMLRMLQACPTDRKQTLVDLMDATRDLSPPHAERVLQLAGFAPGNPAARSALASSSSTTANPARYYPTPSAAPPTPSAAPSPRRDSTPLSEPPEEDVFSGAPPAAPAGSSAAASVPSIKPNAPSRRVPQPPNWSKKKGINTGKLSEKAFLQYELKERPECWTKMDVKDRCKNCKHENKDCYMPNEHYRYVTKTTRRRCQGCVAAKDCYDHTTSAISHGRIHQMSAKAARALGSVEAIVSKCAPYFRSKVDPYLVEMRSAINEVRGLSKYRVPIATLDEHPAEEDEEVENAEGSGNSGDTTDVATADKNDLVAGNNPDTTVDDRSLDVADDSNNTIEVDNTSVRAGHPNNVEGNGSRAAPEHIPREPILAAKTNDGTSRDDAIVIDDSDDEDDDQGFVSRTASGSNYTPEERAPPRWVTAGGSWTKRKRDDHQDPAAYGAANNNYGHNNHHSNTENAVPFRERLQDDGWRAFLRQQQAVRVKREVE